MQDSPTLENQACSLHEWDGLRSRLLFAFDEPLPDGKADGTYDRPAQYGAVLVRRGWMTVESPEHRVTAQAGQWLFCFAEHVRQVLSHDVHVLALRFTNQWAGGSLFFDARMDVFAVDAADHPAIERLAMGLIRGLGPMRLFAENPVFTYRRRTRLSLDDYLTHKRLMLEWITLMCALLPGYGVSLKYPKGADARLLKAMDLIDDLPLSEPFPRGAVEGVSGLTLQQLDRLARASFDTTLRQYWDRRRAQRARFELRRDASSIKQIAFDLGFKRLSHFSAWFKRHSGMPPRAFRDT